MWNAGLKHKLEWRYLIALSTINNLRYADNTTLIAESEDELKSLLMTVKEENEKAGLKLNIRKSKIMAHWLNGHEFEQAPGDGEGQGSLACCSPSTN